MGIEPLGSIPFDPALGTAGDSGQMLLGEGVETAPARAFRAVAEVLVRTLG
jgi:hypothetical protein